MRPAPPMYYSGFVVRGQKIREEGSGYGRHDRGREQGRGATLRRGGLERTRPRRHRRARLARLPQRRGGARRIWEWILSVFPDHRFEVEDAAADGETVAVRGTMTATQEGELMGIAPTGKPVAAQQSHWFRVVDGTIAEHWAVRDDLGMLQQLGVIPEPPQPGEADPTR